MELIRKMNALFSYSRLYVQPKQQKPFNKMTLHVRKCLFFVGTLNNVLLCILALLQCASCNLCTAMLDDPTALKHHGYLSVCLRNQPSPLLLFAMSVCLCWLCLWYLCCCWAQTARADVKHINCLHRPQLNYKDTPFLLCLIYAQSFITCVSVVWQ